MKSIGPSDLCQPVKTATPKPMRLIGERILHLRLRAGISQEHLVNEAEIARSYVAEIDAGQRNISAILICELTRVLGVEPFQLLRFKRTTKSASPRQATRR